MASNAKRPLVIAHRGASRSAPENTLRAFRLAVTQQADMIETDLHMTRDGRIVLTHDAEIGGTVVHDLRLADVRQQAPDVPTLEEALDAVGAEIPFNLEINPRGDGTYGDLVTAARHAVATRGLGGRTLWSSFALEALTTLRAADATARLGVLVSEPVAAQGAAVQARRLDAEAVHPQRSLVTPELVAELHEARLAVHVFTVDDPDDMRRFVGLGIEGIFTNVPARLRALLAGT
jgi:glycerophosphoryl diester phosphodiesterase